MGDQKVGTVRRYVQFASFLACAAWVVSLAGFFEGEHAGFHTIQDSRTIVFSESDADVDTDILFRAISCVPADPTAVGSLLPDGSMDPRASHLPQFRNGIGRLLPPVSQLVATAVLRP
jgi:hypothetical protein